MLPDGIENREVLAGAYRVSRRTVMLSHAVRVSETGEETLLCKRVRLENLADAGAVADVKALPTCLSCLAALRKLAVR